MSPCRPRSWAILDELVRSRGMGLILISHNLHLVSVCDRVLAMYAGQALETCEAGKLAEAKHPYNARPARSTSPARPPPGGAAAVAGDLAAMADLA